VAAYLAGLRRLRQLRRRWPTGRVVAFALGSLATVVALLPPLAAMEDTSFGAHVTQHLLLGMAAPALFALAAPVTLALMALPRQRRGAALKVVNNPVVATLTHPGLAWVLFVFSPFVLYFTPLYRQSIESDLVHVLVHVHFLAAGCLFFWPVLSPDHLRRALPHAGRLLYGFLAIPLHAFLGAALLGAAEPVAPAHTLDDQRVGAGILWAVGDLLGLAVVLIVVLRWMADDERVAEREDRLGSGQAQGLGIVGEQPGRP
jgi:putative membrane protein